MGRLQWQGVQARNKCSPTTIKNWGPRATVPYLQVKAAVFKTARSLWVQGCLFRRGGNWAVREGDWIWKPGWNQPPLTIPPALCTFQMTSWRWSLHWNWAEHRLGEHCHIRVSGIPEGQYKSPCFIASGDRDLEVSLSGGKKEAIPIIKSERRVSIRKSNRCSSSESFTIAVQVTHCSLKKVISIHHVSTFVLLFYIFTLFLKHQLQYELLSYALLISYSNNLFHETQFKNT